MAEIQKLRYLRSCVKTIINHNHMDAVIENAINMAIQDIVARRTWTFMLSKLTATTTSAQDYVAFPSTCDQILELWDVTNERTYEPMGVKEFFETYHPIATAVTGIPEFYTVADERIMVYPVPTGTYNLELLATTEHSILNDEEDTMTIPGRYAQVVIAGAAYYALLHQDRPASAALDRFENLVAQMEITEDRMKDRQRVVRDKFKKPNEHPMLIDGYLY